MYIRAVCCSQTRKNLYIFDNKAYGDFKEATQGKISKILESSGYPLSAYTYARSSISEQ